MTHDHALDYALCRAILVGGDFHWLGLIGSKSKGVRFRSRLHRDGVTAEAIQRLTCPIGIAGVNSKQPAAIAVGIAAQLLQDRGAASHSESATPHDRGAAPNTRGGTPDKPFRDDCASRECSECSSAQDRHT
jgi:xanthine dehydrogenase accessory factor